MAHDLLLQVGIGFDEAQTTRAAQGLAAKINKTLVSGGSGVTFKGVDFALGRITGKANEFQKSLEASNARVIAFGASAGSIFALRAAFQKLVSSTIEVEKSLTDINALLSLGSSDLQTFSNNLFKVANQTGQSFADAAKAATEFSRQGLGVEETLKRTAAALALNRLSGLGFEASVTSLTGILNSFTKEALSAEDVINRLTAVDARYAVSSADLARGLSRVGASANDANVSLNETIALITAAQQVTARGGAVIGNAFKTIFTRLQRPQVLDDLEAAGVAVRDLQGRALPLISVLTNLSQAYDGLAGSQKSFVAETVGGVYQINVLKAILNDLGSGTSIVQGALQTAADSAGSAEARLKILNGTISSSLIRTMNELTQASYNVGTALLGITARSGLSGIQNVLQKVSELSDPTKLIDGNKFTQTFGTLFQGLTKGIGNLLGGPGLQLGVTILLKLLERLQKFIVDSAKDLTGIDSEAKKRIAIEKDVVVYLTKQKDQYQALLDGQITLNDVTKNYLADLRSSTAELKTMSILARGMTNNVAPTLTVSGKTSASGHIPDAEQVAARREQYSPGRTISTSVRHGNTVIPVLANTRETRSTVTGADGLPYDFINPPEGTAAWMRHRSRSLAATGIDPINLKRHAMAGGMHALGIPKAEGDIPENVPRLPLPEFLEEFRNFLNTPLNPISRKPELIGKLLDSAVKSVSSGNLGKKYAQGLPLIGGTGNYATRQVLGGVFSAQRWTEEVTGFTSKQWGDILDSLAGQLTSTNITGLRQEKFAAENTVLNPEDVQKVLSRHAKDFPLIAAYESSTDFTLPKPRETSQKLNVLGHDFNVPLKVLGDTRGVAVIENARKRLASLSEDFGVQTPLKLPLRKAGAAFGTVYDELLSNFFAERGVPVSDSTVENRSDEENNPNAVLDILGYHPDIAKFTGSSEKFAGADAKASVGEGLKSLAKKIFKTLAGDPYRQTLKGPVSQVPPLTNVGQFDTTNKNIGILDSDAFGRGNDFNSFVYSAIATSKPLKVIYGPPGVGKTTKAKAYGGEIVKTKDDLQYYDQFILTSAAAAEDNYKKGVIGLALSSATDIEALTAHPDELRKRLEKRDPLHDPNIKINETSLRKYGQAFDYFKKTYGGAGRFSLTTTAGGFTPNVTDLQSFYQGMSQHYEHHYNKMVEKYGTNKMGGPNQKLMTPEELKEHKYLYSKTTRAFNSWKKARANMGEPLAGTLVPNLASPEIIQRISKMASRLTNGDSIMSKLMEGSGLSDAAFIKAAKVYGINPDEEQSAPKIDIETLFKNLNKMRAREEAWAKIPLSANETKNIQFLQGLFKQRFNELGDISTGEAGKNLPELRDTKNPLNKPHQDFIEHLQTEYYRQPKYGKKSSAHFRGSLLGIDLGIDDKISPSDLKDRREDSLGRYWAKRFTRYAQRGTFAAGAIPAIRDALSRENRATDGRAVLASHPDLVSYKNPLGLAAIDRRQGTVENAIKQHLQYQTMSQVKEATSARGFVPNLATTDNVGNSIALSIVGYFGQMVGASDKISKFALKFPLLASQADVEAAKQKALIDEYDNLREGLINGTIAQGKFNKEVFTGSQDVKRLEDTYKDSLSKIGASLASYQKNISAQRGATSSFGIKASIIGSVGGGIASTIGERVSPTLGAGIEDLSTGVSNAGQALIAFPSRIGKVIGSALLAGGFASAIDTWTKGLENARRTFELEQSASQKLLAKVDALTSSLSNFDTLVGDSSVSQETLNRENRRYIEVLAQIKESPNGAGLATQIETAPDNRTRITRLAEYKQQEGVRIEGLANSQLIKELAAKRSSFGISSGTFAYSNSYDKEGSEQTLLAIASSAIQGASDDFKEKLTNAVGSLEEFNNVISSNNNSLTNLLDLAGKTGKPEDRALLTQEIRSLLATQKVNADPRLQGARAALIAGNETRQQRVDDAIRKEQATRRQFVNQGALQAGNTLDLRSIANALQYSSGQSGLARAQAASGLYQLQFGERTNRAFSASTELSHIELERQNKVNSIGVQSSRSLVDALTQSFDSTLKNAEGLHDVSNNQNQVSIGQFKLQLIEGLNKGISSVIAGGNVDRFQSGGKFNFDALEEAIAKSSGAAPVLQRQIQSYLSNNRSIDILKGIQNANLEIVNINESSLSEAEKTRIAFEGFKKEADFKQLSSFLGGIRNLVDRNSRRTTEREAIRSTYLLEHGTTPEARGIGGAGLLKFFKEQNIPIDLSGGNPLSKLMQKAFQAAAAGLSDVNKGSLGRISGAVSRFGSPGAISGLQSYSNINLNKSAVAALQSEFKPEDAGILGEATKNSADSMSIFNRGLNDSIIAIQSFAASIITVKADLEKAEQNVNNVRRQTSAEAKGPLQNYEDLAKRIGHEMADAVKAATPSQRTNFGGSIPTIIEGGIAALVGGVVATRYLRNKTGRTPLTEQLKLESPVKPITTKEVIGRDVFHPFTSQEDLSEKRYKKARGTFDKRNISALESRTAIAETKDRALTIRPNLDTQKIAKANNAGFGGPDIFSPEFVGPHRPAQNLSGPKLPNPYPGTNRQRNYSTGSTILQTPRTNYSINPNKNAERQATKTYYRQQAAERAANPTGFPVGQVQIPPTPAQSRAAYLRGAVGRGTVSAIGIAGQIAAGTIQNPAVSLAASYGAAYAPSLLGRLGVGGLLKGGGFGIGTGVGIGSAGVGGVLGSGALVAGAAYGGFKTGQYLNKFTTAGKLDEALGEKETDFTASLRNTISKAISKGKSNAEIQKIIDTAINTTQGQLQDSRSGFLTKVFGTTATGSGKSESALLQTIEELKQLKGVAAQAKENQASEQRQEQLQEQLIKVLDKLAGGGGQGTEGASVTSSIKVEISLKDADKIPETLALKLIEPLKKQFADLQTQVGNIAQHVNINPAPAKIG